MGVLFMTAAVVPAHDAYCHYIAFSPSLLCRRADYRCGATHPAVRAARTQRACGERVVRPRSSSARAGVTHAPGSSFVVWCHRVARSRTTTVPPPRGENLAADSRPRDATKIVNCLNQRFC